MSTVILKYEVDFCWFSLLQLISACGVCVCSPSDAGGRWLLSDESEGGGLLYCSWLFGLVMAQCLIG